MSVARPLPASLKAPIVSSAIFHLLVLAVIVVRSAATPPAMPQMYRVNLVAAPAGPRSEGVVTERPAPEQASKAPAAPEKTPPPPTTKAATKRAATPTKAATPNVTKTSKAVQTKAPPKAGGGAVGGAGTDVANVNTAGIEFPFPGYLQNIVRQIALQFEVPRNAASLVAEVTFLIHRDGTVTGIRLKNSGSYVFDQTAIGAVEAAGNAGRFGPLPQGFSDDVLPVIFSFTPERMQ